MRLPLAFVALAACAPSTNDIVIELAPEVVSSIDGTISVHTIAFADTETASGEKISLAVDYTDRNGTPHVIDPVDGKTDSKGAFDATISGLAWDGTGTVTATIGKDVVSTATFAVLDRTPPALTITPPAASSVRLGADLKIAVHVTDEIGISEVFFESSGNGGQGNNGNRDRSTLVASGSADTTVSFDLTVSNNLTVGSTFTVYALAADLSGNQQAATPITLTVVP
jgi:hypothetical protein